MSTLTERYSHKKLALGDSNNMLVRLLFINGVVFVALLFVKVIYLITGQAGTDFMSEVVPWAVLPADLGKLITRPWTLLSYMFVHLSFWQVLSNIIWLWFFGDILQSLSGSKRLIPLYVFGGLAGALFFLVAYHTLPSLRPEAYLANSLGIGAAASVMAIVIGATVLAPKYRIFPMLNGGIPLFVITLIYVGLDVFTMHPFTAGGAGHFTAQAGGALMGWLFVMQIERGNDWGEWLNRFFYKIDHLFDPPDLKSKRSSQKQQFFYKQDMPPFRKIGEVPEKRIDEILDKISEHGYDSLTTEEKDILLRASREEGK